MARFSQLMLSSPYRNPQALQEGIRPKVVLLCGWATTPGTMSLMAKRFDAAGYAPFIFDHGGWFKRLNMDSIASLAERALVAIRELRGDGDRIALVGHSLGGIVGRYLVCELGAAQELHTLVTLGSPHRGSPVAKTASKVPIVAASPSIHEIVPNSDLITRLNAQPFPPDLSVLAIVSDTDRHCPRPCAELEDALLRHDVHNLIVSGIGHEALVIDHGVFDLVKRACDEGVAHEHIRTA